MYSIILNSNSKERTISNFRDNDNVNNNIKLSGDGGGKMIWMDISDGIERLELTDVRCELLQSTIRAQSIVRVVHTLSNERALYITLSFCVIMIE